MRSIFVLAIVSTCILCPAWRALAEEDPQEVEWREVQEAIVRAAQRPPDPLDVLAKAGDRLKASLSALDQFLASGGQENQRLWGRWLELPALRQELDRPRPDMETLSAIHARYFQNQRGLELAPLVAVRKDLGELLTALEFSAAPAADEHYQRRLAELENCLAKLETESDPLASDRAGEIVAWLMPLGDSSAQLAATIRQRYCRTNGVAQVSRRLVNTLMAQKVQEQNFITDFVLGSHVWGPSFTTGYVSFGMVPNARQGTLEVRLQGRNTCPSNVAERGRISVYSSAYTSIQASKRVHFGENGLTLAPAVASCASSIQIDGVDARSRIIERLASRRANQLVPQAEQSAAKRAETEASSQLDAQADAALGGIHDMFCNQIRAPLIRLDALPPQLQFCSDEDHLRLLLGQHSGTQLAAATPAPLVPRKFDLACYAHQSLVTNLCESLLGGTTVPDKAWLELMNLLTGTSPRPLWVHDRGERWSVTLMDEQPIVAQFEGDRIVITLRLSEIQRGQRRFLQRFEVQARLTPIITREGPAFSRDGELAIQFEETVPDQEQAELRRWLAHKFGAVFPPELRLHGLVPPSGGSLGKLRQLRLAELRSSGGWLSLGYELDQAEPTPNTLTEAR